ncbi:MAG: glycosyltransferase [Planctomycetota bacterium]
MKIVHVTPWYPPAWRYGGPVTSVDALVRAQARAGAEVTVLTTDADGAERVESAPLERREGVRVRTFRVAFPRRLFHAPGLSAALAGELERADVVHVHGMFHAPGLAAVRRARTSSIVVSPRGMLVSSLVRERSRLAKRAWLSAFPVEKVALWIASSERERRDLADFRIAATNVSVLPHGVEIPPRSAPTDALVADVLRGPEYVLYLGRLSWKKGLLELIEAWQPQAPATRLVIAGPDDESLGRWLARRFQGLVDAGRLIFVPTVVPADAHALLAGAACLALFSRHENFGNVVFESLAHGTPVVAYDTVGAGEWVARAGAGWITPPKGGAAALGAALADEAERKRRGLAGQELVAHWTWDAVAAETLAAYEASLR